jgi:hypothetical protein
MASAWLSAGAAVFTAVALLLTLVALRAWRHSRSRKVLLLALAFAAFLAKGLLLSVGLFATADWRTLVLPALLLDTAGLLLLYGAALRRS